MWSSSSKSPSSAPAPAKHSAHLYTWLSSLFSVLMAYRMGLRTRYQCLPHYTMRCSCRARFRAKLAPTVSFFLSVSMLLLLHCTVQKITLRVALLSALFSWIWRQCVCCMEAKGKAVWRERKEMMLNGLFWSWKQKVEQLLLRLGFFLLLSLSDCRDWDWWLSVSLTFREESERVRAREMENKRASEE